MRYPVEANQEYKCTFCGLHKNQVDVLIRGEENSHGFICNTCVDKCYDLVHGDEDASEEETDAVTVEEAPAEEPEKSPTPVAIKQYLDQYVVGQETAKITVSVAAYNHYKRVTNPDPLAVEIDKSNILLIGPTGCGKTLIAQSLARYLDVPWVMADATSLTEAGYVGEDVESIIGRLLAAADYNVGMAERGIVFLDEIDKKKASRSASSQRDVSGEGVQQALLKLIEGTEMMVSPPGKKNAERVKINTKNILFIVSGAFVGLDKLIKKEKRAIGFGLGVEAAATSTMISEHLVEFGLIPELVGRLPVVGILEELNEDQLYHVLTEPRNAITKQFRAMFNLDGVDLEFTDEGLRSLARKAIANKTGARGLRGLIEGALLTTQYNLPDMRDIGVEVVIVNDEVFTDGKQPTVRFRKEDIEAQQSV
jgi:ATP-dependent Clp protease ATP-binding subunit ClpX